jgi:phosphate butyryltransferase
MVQAPIHSSDELIRRAIGIADERRRTTVAVAAAQDADVIGAVAQAQADGFIEGILVGDGGQISRLAEEHKIDLSSLTVIDESDIAAAAHRAVRLAADGEADVIMKGFLATSAILKTVLDKQYGLRGMATISHCAVLDIPGYHKLLNFTDGGMVVKPTPEQKFDLVDNAVLVGKALGLAPVKVALSVVRDKSQLDRIAGGIDGILVDGPLSFEAATSRAAAQAYAPASEVAGDADVYVVDSIEECNVVAKSLINFADTVFAGVIVGAKVPVSLVSRTDTIKNKRASLAVACLLADYYGQTGLWESSR